MLCGCGGGNLKNADSASMYGFDTRPLTAPQSERKPPRVLMGDQRYPELLSPESSHTGTGSYNSSEEKDWYESSRIYESDTSRVSKSNKHLNKSTMSIPVLEFFEKPQDGGMVENGKMFQQYKGQLKLSVYVNCGLLTVHVAEARQLSSNDGSTCNSYVKLSLSPDESRRTKCRTDIVKHSNNPKFDEKFSFELLESDMKRRLLITMWNKSPGHDGSEFMGCMSFGVRHIMQGKTVVDGYFFLLSELVGKKKHLKVTTKAHRSCPVHGNGGFEHDEEPANVIRGDILSKALVQQEQIFNLLIQRGEGGFGFTVAGGKPCRVYSVQPGSYADMSGIQPYDHILQIDGKDVTGFAADTVARVIRCCEHELSLKVKRVTLGTNHTPPNPKQVYNGSRTLQGHTPRQQGSLESRSRSEPSESSTNEETSNTNKDVYRNGRDNVPYMVHR